MNDYQPEVGDRVMVNEHGPYEVLSVNERDRTAVLLHVVDGRAATRAGTATWDWLTPAAEPEPDQPTVYGALVRDGDGYLWCRSSVPGSFPWIAVGSSSDGAWRHIPRPITVILTDPAEVEKLRTEVESLTGSVALWKAHEAHRTKQRDEARARADRLQRRVYNLERTLRSD